MLTGVGIVASTTNDVSRILGNAESERVLDARP
jgi:hypothetical protein